jgi:hypothetical protein
MSIPQKETQEHLSHWYHLIHGLNHSPGTFYDALEKRIGEKEIPGLEMGRVTFNEKGLLSGRREYLRVVRGDLVFDICGAPFGKDAFFVSYWLGSLPKGGCLTSLLVLIPLVGFFFEKSLSPMTYFQMDSAMMFQDTIHGIVLGLADELSSQEGVSPIPAEARKPTIKQLSGI